MKKSDCTDLILATMRLKNVNFQQIADLIERDIVWTASALLGQNTMDEKEATLTSNFLGLGKEVSDSLQVFPSKGSLDVVPPTDPLIYRLYEIVLVYGTTIKEVIHEKMGDGIMSAIDFSMHIEKVENPKGDRVKITLDGKFLPYKKW
jgi:cyanate lyase